MPLECRTVWIHWALKFSPKTIGKGYHNDKSYSCRQKVNLMIFFFCSVELLSGLLYNQTAGFNLIN